jgi:hypothetical protein
MYLNIRKIQVKNSFLTTLKGPPDRYFELLPFFLIEITTYLREGNRSVYLKSTRALSPVLRHSEDILMMEAVCRMEPQ